MSGFQVPFSSSPPPSTPDRKSSNGFPLGAADPSTTPAGPPPSSAGSFTPAGPPPSSIYGSSMLGTNNIKPLSFSQQSTFEPSKLQFNNPKSSSGGYMRTAQEPGRSTLSNEYQPSPQRGFQAPQDYSEEDGEDGAQYLDEDDGDDGERNRYDDGRGYADEDADAMTDDDAQYDDDEEMDDYQSEMPGSKSNRNAFEQRSSSDLLLATPDALRESRILNLNESSSSTRPRNSVYGRIAKDMYGQMGIPPVIESDDVVLDTEAVITKLYEEGIGPADNEDMLQHALMVIPGELTNLWAAYHSKTAVHNSEEYTAVIGPGPRASNFAKANFLAGLTLQIHHPQVGDPKAFQIKVKPLPQIMLEWIDEHHDPYPSQLEEIQAWRPSPANHHLFWDTILNALLRGKVVAVVNIMKSAGWKYARAEMDDIRAPSVQIGYTGIALANVEKVIGAAIQVLSQCPAVYGDWDIRGSEWTLFRLRISQALEDLKRFAEGRESEHNESITFEPDHLRMSSKASQSGSYSQTARKAESRVPWHIYQRLVTLYSLVMGESDPIIENAQDWCEGTVGLLVWWDEGKEDRRLALGRSQAFRAARDSDAEVYLRKLRRSFETATADSTDFQVNTLDPVEVGLASLLVGDNEAVVGFLRAWSGPVSSAVAEVASLAGWLPHAEPQSLINMDLDQEDMDLLGRVDSSPSKADGVKDQTLIAYAGALSQRGPLRSRGATKEGWELAIAVLGRLDSAARSEDMVGDFLKGFSLDSSATVDKLWILLNDIGMIRHAENAAESYANLLAEDTNNYGEALWYYALAHKAEKVKDVLNLLISFSLLQSTAFPAESEMDDHLRRLISSPKNALTSMSKMDDEAAELLHRMLSGYATIRRFYTLRDEGVAHPNTKPSRGSSVARKKEAASALLAVISSSDDNIRGGLYDEARGAVVSVDFLLALLGEAMVFVNQPGFFIAVPQIDTLLKAIEDLQTVGPRVYSACSEFLQTVIAHGQGLKGSSPTDMLRKSTSNTSGTSSFSLVGSSMLASQLKQSMSSSGVLVKGNIKRGWDWRRGISANTTGEDVVRILRLGLAKDLAKAWLIEADNKM